METNNVVVKKAFFGRGNCFKVMLNEGKECYFHWGVENNKVWQWVKAKFSDDELGKILFVLEGKKEAVSFFHDYQGKKSQFWVNRKQDAVMIRAKSNEHDITRALPEGDQKVLEIILRHVILKMNMPPYEQKTHSNTFK